MKKADYNIIRHTHPSSVGICIVSAGERLGVNYSRNAAPCWPCSF